ncbi:MAG: dioxygenase [Alphaproteobacteria bacterium]|nr:dioxygenase [Alphaproteobacteria bacterium]
MSTQPSLFVSHGAPTLALGDVPAADFMKTLGRSLGKPKAILVVSAHYEIEGGVAVGTAVRPETVHDFFGFPDALYRLRYEPPGDPVLAEAVAESLGAAGFDVRRDTTRGLDHGVWVPLRFLFPDADVPVIPVSIDPSLSGAEGARHHLKIGQALAPFRQEDVLVIGSGSASHNLHEFRQWIGRDETPDWVLAFVDWLDGRITEGDLDSLIGYRCLAPEAVRNHPSDEHLMPLFASMGAAMGPEGAHNRRSVSGTRAHHSITYGSIAMDAYLFA